jgi:hypothetical protein
MVTGEAHIFHFTRFSEFRFSVQGASNDQSMSLPLS